MLKEELISQTRNPKNYGARGMHTFDDDDDLGLDQEGEEEEAETSSHKPRQELGGHASKYYKGFEENQGGDGQEEQVYDLYYNYEGSGSQQGSKSSNDAGNHHADFTPHSDRHDSGRHYIDHGPEDGNYERAYISKQYQAAKNDHPNSHCYTNTKTSSSSQAHAYAKMRQPRQYQTHDDEFTETSNQHKAAKREYHYNNDEDEGVHYGPQKHQVPPKLKPPAHDNDQEDVKSAAKPRSKQIYYVSKGEPQPKLNPEASKASGAGFDRNNSPQDYNYDAGHCYPANSAQSFHDYQPQDSYSPMLQTKTGHAKPGYTSSEVPVRPTTKEVRHPRAGHYHNIEHAASYETIQPGSYTYDRSPVTSGSGQQPYYAAHASAGYHNQAGFNYGARPEPYNFYSQEETEFSRPQEWTNARSEASGSQLLQKYYPSNGPALAPQHGTPTAPKHHTVKQQKPSREDQL